MIRPIPALFDEALLERGEEACLNFFKTKQVGHQHLINSFDLARDNIEFGSDHDIVAIVGPTEVGTTVLARKLYKHYRDQWPLTQQLEAPKAMVCDAGLMVSISVALPVPPAFVAEISTVNEPVALGVPKTFPVAVLTEMPAGKPVALNDVGVLVASI